MPYLKTLIYFIIKYEEDAEYLTHKNPAVD